ncbi:MAG: helix-turn-helix domain-containing protein [Leadbetterella sp.]|nr:helix-turn-helix domain-containing protein [Leadbetterella sp.]
MLKKDLEIAGLDENEAGAYMALLELGEASIAQIAEKAKLKRPTTYLIIESLKAKGLVNMVKRKKKTLFSSEDPRKILDMLEERKQKMKRIMPELLSFANALDKKPSIQYLEGWEGIKNVYRDTLSYPEQEFQAFFSESFLTRFDEKFFTEFYYDQRLQKKVFVRAIIPDSKMMRELVLQDQKQLRRSKLAPAGMFKMDIEINMYGKNKIGIISFEEDFALIIESKKIHDSLRSLFELTWNLLA